MSYLIFHPGRSDRTLFSGLEDRIRELCGKAVNTSDDQLGPVMKELRATLHDHNQRLRQLAAQKLVPKQSQTRLRAG